MLLAIDIGNTNVTMGVFREDKLLTTWRAATDPARMPDEYAVLLVNLLAREGIQMAHITEAALCSSVPPVTRTFELLCHRYFGLKPLVVGAGVKTGMRILYDDPRAVGADRITDAVAAYRAFGGPVIVVDLGTATVFDAVSREGEYLGGAIAPGIMLAVEALVSRTSMLRRIELVRPPKAIGRNTVHAMQSGLIFGYVGLVEELVTRFQQELGGGARVVATGGMAEIIARETTMFDVIEPDLTLIGLRMIYELNRM
ncbi:MAG: type III pantothenate kinase [Chloroflexi bacterium]|nr:type III pantothenate kinase [Chloroflexota bacterium]